MDMLIEEHWSDKEKMNIFTLFSLFAVGFFLWRGMVLYLD
jgi:hypothetical protein